MVLISMDKFVERFQPDRYEDWKLGIDRAPHPEDDQSKLYPRQKRKPPKPKVDPTTALQAIEMATPEQPSK